MKIGNITYSSTEYVSPSMLTRQVINLLRWLMYKSLASIGV